ncbi:unnamed protein product [Closterium sp. NIES-64]|nr:unnamed protein product [Closterium sp. NIES-64]
MIQFYSNLHFPHGIELTILGLLSFQRPTRPPQPPAFIFFVPGSSAVFPLPPLAPSSFRGLIPASAPTVAPASPAAASRAALPPPSRPRRRLCARAVTAPPAAAARAAFLRGLVAASAPAPSRPCQPPPPAPLLPAASTPPPRPRRRGLASRRHPRRSPPRPRHRLRARVVAASPAAAARAALLRGLVAASAPASLRPRQPPPPAPLPSAASSPPPRPRRHGLASRRRPRLSSPRPRRRLRARVTAASPAAAARAAPLHGLIAASAPVCAAASPAGALLPRAAPRPRRHLPTASAPTQPHHLPPSARFRDHCGSTRSRPSWPPPYPPPPPLPPPIDISSIDKLQLAADKSAINWHSFVGSIRRVLNDAWIPPYRVLDVILRRPHALPPTEPDHPDETPPLPPPPGDPPLEPELQITADQSTADADFIMRRRAYLIRKAEYDAAADAYAQLVAGRTAHLAVVAEYTDDMATFTSKFIAWSAADNRACTVILGALPDSLVRRFQARELRASVIWIELHAMFERRDINSVGILFQEYLSITLATCDAAVDYVGRMREVADRLEARQAGLSEPLRIHRLLFNLTPDYESCLHAFTEANPMADLASPRKQGKSNGKGGGGGKGGSSQGNSGTSSRGGSTRDEHGTPTTAAAAAAAVSAAPAAAAAAPLGTRAPTPVGTQHSPLAAAAAELWHSSHSC